MKPALVIIGLGNHGKTYDHTRHNAGWIALDTLSEQFGEGKWKEIQKFESSVQEGRIGVAPVLLVKPQTYMNLSGDAVRKLVTFYKLNPKEQVLILSDDIDIPLGTVRLRMNGGPGTHNGLKSVVEQFGEDFPRIRIGIGPKPERGDLSAWVLSAFSPDEEKTLQESIADLPNMLTTFVMGKRDSES